MGREMELEAALRRAAAGLECAAARLRRYGLLCADIVDDADGAKAVLAEGAGK